jgi:hypothetical protein
MIYCFDLDNTLCHTENGDYENSIPFTDRIQKVNELFDSGNIIKIFTARGSRTGLDWTSLTKLQLLKWNVKHHELILGKPDTDFFIDDKAINSEQFNWNVDS